MNDLKDLKFEWDEKKNRASTQKHGVSFVEARSSFHDEYAIQFSDPDHSHNEDRLLLLGMSFKLRVLVVCHCFRKCETTVRIISARRADKAEERDYWRHKT